MTSCCVAAALTTAAAAAAETNETAGAGARHWQQETVDVYVDPSLAWLGPSAFEAVREAARAWAKADPDLPKLRVQPLPEALQSSPSDGSLINVVRYAADGAPEAKGALAITSATSEAETLAIVGASIVINGEHRFAILEQGRPADRSGPYDLQNVLTHEFGHFLGLGEDYDDPEATMYVESERGETKKRDLESVDVAAIASLYPTPEVAASGCGGAQMAPSGSPPAAWASLLLGVAVILARRSPARTRDPIAYGTRLLRDPDS